MKDLLGKYYNDMMFEVIGNGCNDPKSMGKRMTNVFGFDKLCKFISKGLKVVFYKHYCKFGNVCEDFLDMNYCCEVFMS
jgi:hypothetical protein